MGIPEDKKQKLAAEVQGFIGRVQLPCAGEIFKFNDFLTAMLDLNNKPEIPVLYAATVNEFSDLLTRLSAGLTNDEDKTEFKEIWRKIISDSFILRKGELLAAAAPSAPLLNEHTNHPVPSAPPEEIPQTPPDVTPPSTVQSSKNIEGLYAEPRTASPPMYLQERIFTSVPDNLRELNLADKIFLNCTFTRHHVFNSTYQNAVFINCMRLNHTKYIDQELDEKDLDLEGLSIDTNTTDALIRAAEKERIEIVRAIVEPTSGISDIRWDVAIAQVIKTTTNIEIIRAIMEPASKISDISWDEAITQAIKTTNEDIKNLVISSAQADNVNYDNIIESLLKNEDYQSNLKILLSAFAEKISDDNARQHFKNNLLAVAETRNDLDACKFAKQWGADVNTYIGAPFIDTDNDGRQHSANHLIYAYQKYGRSPLFIWLMENVDYLDAYSDRQTILHLAVEKDDVETVKDLINAGADYNIVYSPYNRSTFNYRSPLILAYEKKNTQPELYQALYQKMLKQDPQKVNLDGQYYFIKQLLRAKDEETLKSMSEEVIASVNNNYQSIPLLHIAVREGNLNNLKLLLKCKADLNFQIGKYYDQRVRNLFRAHETALHCAVRYGNPDIVRELCEAGADLTICDNSSSGSSSEQVKTPEQEAKKPEIKKILVFYKNYRPWKEKLTLDEEQTPLQKLQAIFAKVKEPTGITGFMSRHRLHKQKPSTLSKVRQYLDSEDIENDDLETMRLNFEAFSKELKPDESLEINFAMKYALDEILKQQPQAELAAVQSVSP